MKISPPFIQILQQILQGNQFSAQESRDIFDYILSGSVPHAQTAAFLALLRMRGETIDELEGAVSSMRHHMLPIEIIDPYTIDVCGTGGDGQNTLNISTAVCFILAALGISVAKHGNRGQSSQSGAVDVLAALNILPESNLEILQKSLSEHKITFLSAFIHHPILKNINVVRRELGIRTIFNLVGPLSNPAKVKYQMIGVYDERWLLPIIHVLRNLGSKRVWTIHGKFDSQPNGTGADEITLAGPSKIIALEDDKIIPVELTFNHIKEVDLTPSPISSIIGGNPSSNAKSMIALLNGEKGAYRDTVLINAAIAIHIAQGRSLIDQKGDINCEVLKSLVLEAANAIDSGAALSVLKSIQNLK